MIEKEERTNLVLVIELEVSHNLVLMSQLFSLGHFSPRVISLIPIERFGQSVWFVLTYFDNLLFVVRIEFHVH